MPPGDAGGQAAKYLQLSVGRGPLGGHEGGLGIDAAAIAAGGHRNQIEGVHHAVVVEIARFPLSGRARAVVSLGEKLDPVEGVDIEIEIEITGQGEGDGRGPIGANQVADRLRDR